MTNETGQSVDLMTALQERGERRAERFRTTVTDTWSPLHDTPANTWLGMVSRSSPANHYRELHTDYTVWLFPDLPQSPVEIARDYLMIKFGGERRRITTNQYHALQVKRPAALYARPGTYEDMVYCDIKSAYWSITSIVGWDVDYMPGRFINKRSEPRDFPLQENRISRNSLVTIGMKEPVSYWTGTEIIRKVTGNPLANTALYAVVQDTLHAIARVALAHGAVYVNTDGYIIPRRHVSHFQQEIRKAGLNARIKHHGDAVVKGAGIYRVGDYQTRNFNARGGGIKKIMNVDPHWILPRVGKLARIRVDG